MGEPFANTVVVEIRENEPDGAVTKKSQLDDFIREFKFNVKTFLERSMVAFGEAKAGEMKPGSAVMLVAPPGNPVEVGFEHFENRLVYLVNDRKLVSYIDRGSGVVQEDLVSGGIGSWIGDSDKGTVSQELTTTYADLERIAATPLEVSLTVGGADLSVQVQARVEAIFTVHNTSPATRAAAFKLRHKVGAGAFADVAVGFSHRASIRLRNDEAQQVHLIADVQLTQAPAAANTIHAFRIQGRANDDDVLIGSASVFSGETPETSLLAVPRRRA